MNHDVAVEQLEAYVLGALEPDEAHALEAHIADCEICLRSIAMLRDPAEGLALLVAADADDAAALPPLRPPPAASPVVQPTAERRHARSTPLRAPSRAAVFALVVLLVGALGFWTGRVSHSEAQERQLRQELSGMVERQEVVLEVVDGANTVKRLLRSTTGSTAYGKVYTRPGIPHLVAMAGRLEALADDSTYELTLTVGGEERDVGLLRVERTGFGLLVVDFPGDPPPFEAARVVRRGADGSVETVLAWSAP